MTVDGFGFGTLTGESCQKNVHCHTDRASWDAILVTVVAFGALMWKSVHSHTVSAWGGWGGGGIPLGGGGGGGGSANREPGSYIYIYTHTNNVNYVDTTWCVAPQYSATCCVGLCYSENMSGWHINYIVAIYITVHCD